LKELLIHKLAVSQCSPEEVSERVALTRVETLRRRCRAWFRHSESLSLAET